MKEMNEKLRNKVLELAVKTVPPEKKVQGTVMAFSCSSSGSHVEFEVTAPAYPRL
jgi:hypothetical protein